MCLGCRADRARCCTCRSSTPAQHSSCFHATGDVRKIVGQPVFVPLYKLFLTYGKIFRLSFGPKHFVVISDAAMAKQVRWDVYTTQETHCSGG